MLKTTTYNYNYEKASPSGVHGSLYTLGFCSMLRLRRLSVSYWWHTKNTLISGPGQLSCKRQW